MNFSSRLVLCFEFAFLEEPEATTCLFRLFLIRFFNYALTDRTLKTKLCRRILCSGFRWLLQPGTYF